MKFTIKILMLWAFIFSILPIIKSFAQDESSTYLMLSDTSSQGFLKYLKNKSEIFKDSTNGLNLEKIKKMPFRKMLPKGMNYPSTLLDIRSTYWVRLRIINHSKVKNWYLEFPDHKIDSLAGYVLLPDTVYLYQTGDHLPIKNRTFDHKNFIFRIPVHELPFEMYFRIKASREVATSVHVKSDKELLQLIEYEYLSLGIFYGSLVIIFMLNIFVLIRLKQPMYLYYCIYLLFFFLYSSTQDGLFIQLSDLHNLPFYNYYYSFFFTLSVIFQYIYAISFLKIRSSSRLMFKALWGVIFARTILALGLFLFYPEGLGFLYIDLIVIAGILIVGMIRYFEGFKPARLFILGDGFLLIGYSIHSLSRNGYLVNSTFTVYSTQLGIFIEFIFLTLAFADRFNFEIKEKLKAQEQTMSKNKEIHGLQERLIKELEEKQFLSNKVNSELETLVEKRTLEIQEANDNLKLQAAVIQSLNSKLDKEYYSVKKELTSTFKEKIFGYTTDSEFEQTIQSEGDCLLYLSDLKWAEGFTCVKCKNESFVFINRPLHRKCKQCYYVESPTANTIFHKIKFPLYSAFKLTFWTLNNKKLTIDQIAKSLDIRVATVSVFKNKVTSKAEKLKKMGNYSIKSLFLN